MTQFSQRSNFKFASVIASVLLLIVIISTSCQKSGADAKSSPDNAVNEQKLVTTNDFVEASNSDEENFDMVMGNGEYADASDAAANAVSANLSNKVPSGKTVTYSPSKNVYPYTKTIDFGAGYTDAKGNIKSGKIIITYYDAAKDIFGLYSKTTYDNFYMNGVHIEGNAQINKTKNSKGQDVYVHLVHRKLSNAGSVKDFVAGATWTVINWQGGINNAYEISLATSLGTETYNGIEAGGFVTYVDNAHHLIKPFACGKRVQGVIVADIHLADAPLGHLIQLQERLDYGNGDCDDIATLTVNGGEPTVITLPLRFWPLSH